MFVGALKEMEKLLCDLKKMSWSRKSIHLIPDSIPTLFLLGDAVCLANDELLRAKFSFNVITLKKRVAKRALSALLQASKAYFLSSVMFVVLSKIFFVSKCPRLANFSLKHKYYSCSQKIALKETQQFFNLAVLLIRSASLRGPSANYTARPGCLSYFIRGRVTLCFLSSIGVIFLSAV
jgi:hypothetical protein